MGNACFAQSINIHGKATTKSDTQNVYFGLDPNAVHLRDNAP